MGTGPAGTLDAGTAAYETDPLTSRRSPREVHTSAGNTAPKSVSVDEIHHSLLRFLASRRSVGPDLEYVAERVSHALGELLLSLDSHEVLNALREPQDVDVLARLLEQHRRSLPPPVDPSEPTEHERRLAAQIQEELIEAAGGTLSVLEAAELLARPEEAVSQLIRRGRLLAVRVSGSEQRIPACQVKDGAIVPGLGRVLRAMPVANDWTRLSDLLQPLEGLEGSPTLLDLLSQREASYAVELASRLHDTGGL